MVPEAPFERNEAGVYPAGEGWFVVNARDLRWFESELGLYTMFDSDEARFEQVGVNIGILVSPRSTTATRSSRGERLTRGPLAAIC